MHLSERAVVVDLADKPVVWATGEIVPCGCFFSAGLQHIRHLMYFQDLTRISSQPILNFNGMQDDEEDEAEVDSNTGEQDTSAAEIERQINLH
jgi:hypothetical protein